jgi:hypothetical protein
MAGTIRTCFANGGREPLERLDVPEGEILTVTIIRLPPGEAGGGIERSAGGWKDLIGAADLKRHIDADPLISMRPEPRLRRSAISLRPTGSLTT